eukprot:3308453-Pleurochrysis_carterae.AAC.6
MPTSRVESRLYGRMRSANAAHMHEENDVESKNRLGEARKNAINRLACIQWPQKRELRKTTDHFGQPTRCQTSRDLSKLSVDCASRSPAESKLVWERAERRLREELVTRDTPRALAQRGRHE